MDKYITASSCIEVVIDFTRPDGQRTRPLLVDGKRLYVDEHYISVWSPVLRAWCVECPDRELILANVQYDHVLEMLHCIHPTYKEVDDQSVHILLPLAFDYQMEGLLHRCECFLVNHRLPFLEKVWLADREEEMWKWLLEGAKTPFPLPPTREKAQYTAPKPTRRILLQRNTASFLSERALRERIHRQFIIRAGQRFIRKLLDMSMIAISQLLQKHSS
uniref:BTB domain-containing protein n=1 Tax=Parascaris univalens TaxID=6257 RepID=A0A914ZVG7_PARUN